MTTHTIRNETHSPQEHTHNNTQHTTHTTGIDRKKQIRIHCIT